MRARFEFERLRLSGGGKERCEVALDIVEVRGAPHLFRHAPLLRETGSAHHRRERVDLARRRPIDLEARAMLEEPDAVLLSVLVLERRAQEPRTERDAQYG